MTGGLIIITFYLLRTDRIVCASIFTWQFLTMKLSILLLIFYVNTVTTLAKNSLPSIGKPSLYFTENKGQITDQYFNPRLDIDFKLSTRGVNVYVGAGALQYQFVHTRREDWGNLSNSNNAGGIMPFNNDRNNSVEMYRMDVTLVGCNTSAL